MEQYTPPHKEEKGPVGNSPVERHGSVATITKPTGTFTILYGNHFFPENPENLPHTATGIFLESAEDWSEAPLTDLYMGKIRHQSAAIFPHIEERRIPVYFSDPYFRGKVPLYIAEGGLLGIEAVVGTRLLRSARKQWQEQRENLSRRTFLTISAKTLAGVYGLLPATTAIARWLPLGHAATAGAVKFSHAVHPEEFLFTTIFRNAVIAHKQEWLAKQRQQQHFVSLLGGMHVEIEDAIALPPERRLAFLRRVIPLIRPLLAPRTFSTMEECTYNGSYWRKGRTHVVPDLEDLLS